MLYLKNTNQMQSLGGGVLRGPAAPPPPPPPPTPTLNYFDGLGRTVYNGFIEPTIYPNNFATASVVSGPTMQNGILIPALATPTQFRSTQWLGYFKASTTETYTFYILTDDSSVLWLGNAATASVLTTGSAVVVAPTSVTIASGSISLTSGSYYPMRVQYTDGRGAQYFSSSFSTPSIPERKDYNTWIFANTASLGF
jgi:hypothetical protein